jgi:DNA-directed RNA polymerase subunit RPC12/RpoP
MDFHIACDQCHSKATVLRHVYRLSELAEIALTLGLIDPVEPYMIINCPKCGIRGVEPPSPEPESQDRV